MFSANLKQINNMTKFIEKTKEKIKIFESYIEIAENGLVEGLEFTDVHTINSKLHCKVSPKGLTEEKLLNILGKPLVRTQIHGKPESIKSAIRIHSSEILGFYFSIDTEDLVYNIPLNVQHNYVSVMGILGIKKGRYKKKTGQEWLGTWGIQDYQGGAVTFYPKTEEYDKIAHKLSALI